MEIEDFRRKAHKRLPRAIFAHLEAGAGHSEAVLRNRAALDRVLFAPRALVDVTQIDTTSSLFGAPLAFPALVGPSGLNALFRHDADEALARAAARAGVPFVHATASSTPVERIREVSSGVLWLQLYVQDDRRLAEGLMQRAQAAGYQALVVTVDTPRPGKRTEALRAGFRWPVQWSGPLLADMLRHPRWSLSTLRRGIPQLGNLAVTADRTEGMDISTMPLSTPGLQWSDIGWLRNHRNGKLILKGLLAEADIRYAEKLGVDGVVISNHGGRQIASAPAPIDILLRLSQRGRPAMEIFIDGGIRYGEDIAKAVAAGATAVLLGRPSLYGLIAAGENGVDSVLAILRDELELCLSLLGCAKISDLTKAYLDGHSADAIDSQPSHEKCPE